MLVSAAAAAVAQYQYHDNDLQTFLQTFFGGWL